MSMTFDAYAALRNLEAEHVVHAIAAIPAIPVSGEQPEIAEIARIAASQVQKPENAPGAGNSGNPAIDAPSPYGQTFGGRQRTWTGKIVSLDEWRRATEWERYGSTGKMWNGITQKWESTT